MMVTNQVFYVNLTKNHVAAGFSLSCFKKRRLKSAATNLFEKHKPKSAATKIFRENTKYLRSNI